MHFRQLSLLAEQEYSGDDDDDDDDHDVAVVEDDDDDDDAAASLSWLFVSAAISCQAVSSILSERLRAPPSHKSKHLV